MNEENNIIEILENVIDALVDNGSKLLDDITNNETITTIELVGEGIGDSIDAYKALKAIASIPNILFMRKFERYLKGLLNLTEKDKQKIKDKLNKDFSKDKLLILNAINNTDEEEKIDIYSKITKLLLDDEISIDEHRKFILMTRNATYDDLMYLKKCYYSKDRFDDLNDETLLSNGWTIVGDVKVDSTDPSERFDDDDVLQYLNVEIEAVYTNDAVYYCNKVLSDE